MAKVAFKKGLQTNLPVTKNEGTFYITIDERALYLDVDDTTRVRIGDFQEFDTLAALRENTNPSTTALYYVADFNCLAKWDGSRYVQINLDTGATSVETTGSGNALDGVSYDAATRKLTFTKTKTFPTADDVDTKINEKIGSLNVEETSYPSVAAYVTAYVTGKTTELDSRVSAAEEKVSTLTGEDTGKSVRTIASEELTKQLIPENAKDSLDTLSEIASWIQSHPDDAAAMNRSIAALSALIGTLPDSAESATVVEYIKEYADSVISALSDGDYAKAADLTAAIARITALETTSHSHSNHTVLDNITSAKVTAWDASEQNAKNYTNEALTWGSF